MYVSLLRRSDKVRTTRTDWIPGTFLSVEKRLEHKNDHTSTWYEGKNVWN